MVNHFRTLLLNKTVADTGVRFSEFVSSDFAPIPVTAPETAARYILLGGSSSRETQEFSATIVFRLMHDCPLVRQEMEKIDSRLTFDPHEPYSATIPTEDFPPIPTIPILWDSLKQSGTVSQLFRSSGKHSEKLIELYRAMSQERRRDYKVALTALGLCLRANGRIIQE